MRVDSPEEMAAFSARMKSETSVIGEKWKGEKADIHPATCRSYGLEIKSTVQDSREFHTNRKTRRIILRWAKKGSVSAPALQTVLLQEVNSSFNGICNQSGQRGKAEKCGISRQWYNKCVLILDKSGLLSIKQQRKRDTETGQRRKAAHLITFPIWSKELYKRGEAKFNAMKKKLSHCFLAEKDESQLSLHEYLYRYVTQPVVDKAVSNILHPHPPDILSALLASQKHSSKSTQQMNDEFCEAIA